MGLRIIERVREEYGGDADAHVAEQFNPFTNPSNAKKALQLKPNRHLFSNADKEDIEGGFLIDDDGLDGGGFLPEGHDESEVPHEVGELTVEDERDPADSDPLNGSPVLNSGIVNRGPPVTDNNEEALPEADLDDRVTVPKKASKNGKKAATTTSGPKGNAPTNSPKRREAPKRKAARKSETALKSHFVEHDSDEGDNSDRGSLTSRAVAVKKPAKKRKFN